MNLEDKIGNGILSQIEGFSYYYPDSFSFDDLLKCTEEIFKKEKKSSNSYIWYALNTVTYSGTTLHEVRINKIAASKNASLIKEIQGFRPKLRFKYNEKLLYSRRSLRSNTRNNRKFRRSSIRY